MSLQRLENSQKAGPIFLGRNIHDCLEFSRDHNVKKRYITVRGKENGVDCQKARAIKVLLPANRLDRAASV